MPAGACWEPRARRAAEASAGLPGLPSFEQVLCGDRDRMFGELGYTFWNRELIDALAARLRRESVRRWVELAAGTGRWAAELSRRGVEVAATDDFSQSADRVRSHQRAIQYGRWVARLGAAEAVRELRPDGLLCAWPPLGSSLVPDVLAGTLPGSSDVWLVLCIGEPGGATEAPAAGELPEGWALESWPECERYLIGFNDPRPGPGWRSHSRLLVYRRQPCG